MHAYTTRALRTASLAMIGGFWAAGVAFAQSRPEAAPDSPQAVARRAFDLRMNGTPDDARRVLDEALTSTQSRTRLNTGDVALLRFESARLHFVNCEFDLAKKDIRKAIEADPANARCHYWAGTIGTFRMVWQGHSILGMLSVPGEMIGAREAYERAVSLRKNFHEARLELINLYLNEPFRNTAKARRHIQTLEQLDPVFAGLAKSRQLGSRGADEQVALWSGIAAAYPNRADAHVGLGRALYLRRDYKKAVAEFTKALEIDPTRTDVLFGLARCHQAAGDTAAQAECYRRILNQLPERHPSRIRAMRFLASVEEKRGNRPLAESLRRQADEMDPRRGKRGAVRDDVFDLLTPP